MEVQEEIVRELEQYQKIIDGAKQVVDNYKPVIDIDPSWEMIELEILVSLFMDSQILQKIMEIIGILELLILMIMGC